MDTPTDTHADPFESVVVKKKYRLGCCCIPGAKKSSRKCCRSCQISIPREVAESIKGTPRSNESRTSCSDSSTCKTLRGLGRALGWIYRHPTSRLFLIFSVLVLNCIMFSEDPQTYSNSDISIPFFGQIYNFCFTGYPSASFNQRWLILKCGMFFLSIALGIIFGELLVRKWLFQKLFSFRNFKRDKGILLCSFVGIVCFLWGFIQIYTVAVNNNDSHTMSFMNNWNATDFGTEPGRAGGSPDTPTDQDLDGWCDFGDPVIYNKNSNHWKAVNDDLKRTVPSSRMPLSNGVFSLGAFYITILGDTYAFFSILDETMQKKMRYRGCCKSTKENLWSKFRIPLFWIVVILCFSFVGAHLGTSGFLQVGHLYWQGNLASVAVKPGYGYAAHRVTDVAAGFEETCDHIVNFEITWEANCSEGNDFDIGKCTAELQNRAKKGQLWASSFYHEKISNKKPTKYAKFKDCCDSFDYNASWDSCEGLFGERNPSTNSDLGYLYRFKDERLAKSEKTQGMDWYHLGTQEILALCTDALARFSQTMDTFKPIFLSPLTFTAGITKEIGIGARLVFPSRGFFGMTDVTRVNLAVAIFVMNLLVFTQDEEFFKIPKPTRRGKTKPGSRNNGNNKTNDGNSQDAMIPGLSSNSLNVPTLSCLTARCRTFGSRFFGPTETFEATDATSDINLNLDDNPSEVPRKKKSSQFITARWLTYSVLFVVTGLDAVNLYSQLSYFPGDFDQVVAPSGFIYSKITNESMGFQNFQSDFEYDFLEKMCPFGAGGMCVSPKCEKMRMEGKSLGYLGRAGRAENSWLDYLGLESANLGKSHYQSVVSTRTTVNEFHKIAQEFVVSPSYSKSYIRAKSEARASYDINNRRLHPFIPTSRICTREKNVNETKPNYEYGNSYVFSNLSLDAERLGDKNVEYAEIMWSRCELSNVTDETSILPAVQCWGWSCSCYKITSVSLSLEKSLRVPATCSDKVETVGTPLDGTLSPCFFGNADELYAKTNADLAAEIKGMTLLDGRSLETTCDNAMFYEMALGRRSWASLVDLVRSYNPTSPSDDFVNGTNNQNSTFNKTSVRPLDILSSSVWLYPISKFNDYPRYDTDIRCTGCLPIDPKKKEGDENSERTLRYFGAFEIGNIPSPGVLAPALYFSDKCLDAKSLSKNFGEESSQGDCWKIDEKVELSEHNTIELPKVKMLSMKCVLTSGKLNIRYLGRDFSDKLLSLIIAGSVLAGVVFKIVAHQIIESLIRWKRKRKEKLRPVIVSPDVVVDDETDPALLEYHTEERSGLYGFKKKLLSFCMCICCKKKIQKMEEYETL